MIRLIRTSDLTLHVFEGKHVPEYAILSHRWEDGEISLQDLQNSLDQDKQGWQKLRNFCQYTVHKGHEYVWIDTCCIDKTSSAELSEAINSMFRWYQRAVHCYAYLCDIPGRNECDASEWLDFFRGSKWFTRGWTLQELLAPQELTFISSCWREELGTRQSFSSQVAQVTGIPEKPLIHGWTLKDDFGGTQYAVSQIMSWASQRQTTRVEDMAYSLMGLFRINMPLLYGEGPNAFVRLQLEIMSKYNDNSLFAWSIPVKYQIFRSIRALNGALDIPTTYCWEGLLAPTVKCFQDCSNHVLHLEKHEDARLFQMTNRGIQVEGSLRRYARGRHGDKHWLMLLNCGRQRRWKHRFGIVLAGDGQLAMRMLDIEGMDSDLLECDWDAEKNMSDEYEHRKIFIPQAWPGDFD